MGRIVFDTASSLNGWIADEDQSLDWLFSAGQAETDGQDATSSSATVIVEGSTTYEWVLEHEALLQHPEKWQQYFGDKPTFVFTRRSLPVPGGADVRFVSGTVDEVLPQIRTAAGDGDIWIVGGGDLAGQFLDAGALDRIAVSIAPAALTGGAPLLPRRVGADRLCLESVERQGPFARLVYSVLQTDRNRA